VVFRVKKGTVNGMIKTVEGLFKGVGPLSINRYRKRMCESEIKITNYLSDMQVFSGKK
jgi:hypothetical protein